MSVPSVSVEPRVRLAVWALLRDIHGYRLVGRRHPELSPRLSSPVERLDLAAGEAVTESGRRYTLIGQPDPELAAGVMAMFYQWHPFADPVLVSLEELPRIAEEMAVAAQMAQALRDM
ncbi:hypothetical protein [Tianweitania sediminis]|uniref:Uncharacterized protein n=1 Tax=Tianweitania sediminis TaxID=1502156 RepID=A0A8J7UL84_9HYPH|nr:hypothetical protein [Tianweitania sediminis]MBP0439132.1 hypothetical protein [Tianweitania sediminis]